MIERATGGSVLVISSILATTTRNSSPSARRLLIPLPSNFARATSSTGFPGSAAGERAVQVLTAGDPELGEDLVEVVLDGARTDEQTGADLGI